MQFLSRLLFAVALCVGSSFAFAAPGHGDHDQRSQRSSHNNHHDRRHDNRRHESRRHDNRRYDNHHRYDNRRHVVYRDRPHYSHRHRWQRGHRYYGPTYVVRDYRHYRLRQPPRGYRWVQSNNDYLLVAVATGIILDIALR
ncbi:MAG: RcnB family protein [Rhodanobacter sp.]